MDQPGWLLYDDAMRTQAPFPDDAIQEPDSTTTSALQRRYGDELVATARELGNDGVPIADLKLAAGALKEMARAFRLFAPYRGVRKVSTFGSARTEPGDPEFKLAQELSRRIVERGYMVITGAGPGIMEACQHGAGRERSFGVNIQLPFEQSANVVISGDAKLINFKYFFTRKLFFIKEADAVVLFPGGFGTHDEGFEVLTLLQTGKTKPIPLVLLDAPRGTYWKTWQRYVEDHILRRGMIAAADLRLYKVTASVDAAVEEIVNFYRVYHSLRYVGDRLVMRLLRPLSAPFLKELAIEFKDIIGRSGLEQRAALSIERAEKDIAHLPRLVLRFNRLHFGRLRQLIDRINSAPDAE